MTDFVLTGRLSLSKDGENTAEYRCDLEEPPHFVTAGRIEGMEGGQVSRVLGSMLGRGETIPFAGDFIIEPLPMSHREDGYKLSSRLCMAIDIVQTHVGGFNAGSPVN